MERVISQITNQFFNRDIQQIDEIIEDALKQIGEATQVDRISLLEFNAERTSLKVAHEWCAENIPTIVSQGMERFEVAKFEKIRSEFKKDRILLIPDCTQIDGSVYDSLSLVTKKLEVRTLLLIPLVSQKHPYGLLFLQSIENLKNWDEIETDLFLLKMIGEMFSILRERLSSEQLFYTSFTNSPNMMAIIRRSDFVILNANPMLLKTLEYTKEEVVDQPDEDITLIEDRGQREQIMEIFDTEGFVGS